MTQAVRDVIFRPMQALYPPPTYLRTNSEDLKLALAAYEQALSRFDRETLQRGWDHALAEQDYWCWPTPATLVACRLHEPRQKPPSEEERCQQQAFDMADAYRAGRPSLACDLMEPLRVPAVDRWVVEICNEGQLSPDHFVSSENQGTRLRPAALGRIIGKWEGHWVRGGHERSLDLFSAPLQPRLLFFRSRSQQPYDSTPDPCSRTLFFHLFPSPLTSTL